MKSEEKRKKDIIKVIASIILCLVMFAVGFYKINSLSLTALTEEAKPISGNNSGERINDWLENLPGNGSITPEFLLYTEEYYRAINFMVIVESEIEPSINAMSAEAAANLGAIYIFELLGESIDGKVVIMNYSNHPSSVRTYWHGRVIEMCEIVFGDEQLYRTSSLHTFSLDAVTGKRIAISTTMRWRVWSDEVRAAIAEISETDGQRRRDLNEILEVRVETPQQSAPDDFAAAAAGFAQLHFMHTEVSTVEFRDTNAIDFNLDADGTLYISDRQLIFEVTDCTGRIADMAISERTKGLLWLNTGFNDIVPGWNYAGGGIG